MDADYRSYSSSTGNSLQTSKSYSGFSHSQAHIIPYSEPCMDNTRYAPPPQPPRSKSTSSWSIANPDAKRRRRIASYKVYTAERKAKLSLSRSFRWIKNKYIELRYGLL
ncbi:hypothetical protein L7F22_067025 [Adiantum nelumboides]|nr:hypothetical protein [Adiantum nelumboides]